MSWSRISRSGAPPGVNDSDERFGARCQILIRAALGKRVHALLKAYEDLVAFYTPDVCFDDARKYIPQVLSSRGDDPETGIAVLDQIRLLVQPVDEALYRDFG